MLVARAVPCKSLGGMPGAPYLPCGIQTLPVGAAAEIGIGSLYGIVLPAADGADFVHAAPAKDGRPAAGTRRVMLAGHCRSQYARPLWGLKRVRGTPRRVATPKVLL
jgi:hypothetical protein